MNDFGIDSHEQQPSILRMASNSLNGAICNVRIIGRNINHNKFICTKLHKIHLHFFLTKIADKHSLHH